MAKVLYISGTSRPGGAWESLRDIVFGLERDRFEPVVACSKEPAWHGSRDGVDVVLIKMPMFRKGKNILHIPLAIGRLRRVVRSYQVSLLHANSVWDVPYALRAAKPSGVPVVAHVRTEIDRDKARKYGLYKSDVVICTSRRVVDVLSGFESLTGRVFYVPNGVDFQRFARTTSRGESRRRFGLDDNAVVFGAVGRIDRLKGLDLLVEAFSRVAGTLARARLLIVGDARGKGRSFEDELRGMVEQLGLSKQVIFAGHQDNPVPSFAALDVLVMPSRTEGFGRSVAEAMVMAKPVIASDVGALPEIVGDGHTGYVVPDGDVDGLASRMSELAADQQKREVFGRAGRAVAEARFGLKTMLRRLQSIYDVLLRGSDGGRDSAS